MEDEIEITGNNIKPLQNHLHVDDFGSLEETDSGNKYILGVVDAYVPSMYGYILVSSPQQRKL